MGHLKASAFFVAALWASAFSQPTLAKGHVGEGVKGTRFARVTTEVPHGIDQKNFSKVIKVGQWIASDLKDFYKDKPDKLNYIDGLLYNLENVSITPHDHSVVAQNGSSELLWTGQRKGRYDFQFQIEVTDPWTRFLSVYKHPKRKKYQRLAATTTTKHGTFYFNPEPVVESWDSLITEEARNLLNRDLFPTPKLRTIDSLFGLNAEAENPYVWKRNEASTVDP